MKLNKMDLLWSYVIGILVTSALAALALLGLSPFLCIPGFGLFAAPGYFYFYRNNCDPNEAATVSMLLGFSVLPVSVIAIAPLLLGYALFFEKEAAEALVLLYGLILVFWQLILIGGLISGVMISIETYISYFATKYASDRQRK